MRNGNEIRVEWFWVTRTIGVAVFLFGVFLDRSPERGTIILAGAGLAGFDKVARSEPPKDDKKHDTDS